MPRLTPVLALFALAGVLACVKTTTVPPDTTANAGGSEVPAGAVDPGPDPAADGGATPDDGGATTPPTTTTCLRDADCGDGVCEGQGCGDAEPGTCVAKNRMCTRDSRPYCGCDGQTFRASGTCPGRRYASEGECSGTAP
jgi:hypothetical protein